MKIEVLVFQGCPHANEAFALTESVVRNLAPQAEVKMVFVEVGLLPREGFYGSPTILVNGRDIEGKKGASCGLTCRLYEGGKGVPPRWLIETALLRALEPRNILFLCVNNSARSQMAEGIARKLLSPEIAVWSAGSEPTEVRNEAITVLGEIGIDISHHRPKSLGEIPVDKVDVVITLCAEEVCPLFFGKVTRLHWPLEDPTKLEIEEERLQAFRMVRDELYKRISTIV